MLGRAPGQVNAKRHYPLHPAGALIGILQWTYICLYDIIYANKKDGTIPQGTAAGETPEAIRENRRTRRRIGSPRHRCVLAFEEEGIEMKKRAAIYARVSTGDQHVETQAPKGAHDCYNSNDGSGGFSDPSTTRLGFSS